MKACPKIFFDLFVGKKLFQFIKQTMLVCLSFDKKLSLYCTYFTQFYILYEYFELTKFVEIIILNYVLKM